MRSSFYHWWLCLLLAVTIGCGGKKEETKKDNNGTDNKATAKTDDTKSDDTKPANSTDTKPKGTANSTPSNTGAIASNGFNASYISDDFFAALVIHPRKLMNSELVKSLPQEMKDEMLQNMPFDPAGIEQVVLLAAPFPPEQLKMMMMGGGGFGGDASFDLPPETPDSIDADRKSGAAENPNGAAALEVPNIDQVVIQDADFAVGEDAPFEGPAPGGPSFADNVAAIIRFVDADSAKNITTMITEDSKVYDHNGKKYFKPYEGAQEAAFVPDDKTVVVGGEERIKKILSALGIGMSPLISRLTKTSLDSDVVGIAAIEPIRELLAGIVPAKEPGDESPIPDGAEMLKKLQSLSIFANASAGDLVALNVETTGGAATTEIKDALNGMLAFGKMMAPTALKQIADSDPQGELAGKVAGQLLNGIKVAENGNSVTISIARPEGFNDTINQAIATARIAAQSAQRKNTLRQVGLAMHNYHDTYRALPNNGKREGDEAASSWRVKVLPFLEEQFLYEDYAFDEAWDGENNKRLLDQPCFWLNYSDTEKDPPRTAALRGTTIMVFTGKGTPFSEDKPAKSLADITDGTSLTIYAVQLPAATGVPWTKPADIAYDVENPLKCLGTIPEEGILAIFFDGSVHTIPKDIDAETFRKLVDPSDGGDVEIDF